MENELQVPFMVLVLCYDYKKEGIIPETISLRGAGFASIAFGHPNAVCLGRTQTPDSRNYRSRNSHIRQTAL